MALAGDTIQALARELYDARKRRVQVRQFSRRYPGMTILDGYAVQRAWVRLEQADGRIVKGRFEFQVEPLPGIRKPALLGRGQSTGVVEETRQV